MTFGSHTRAPHESETGSALIEVMVSATILLAAIISLFLVLDVQGTASGTARESSVAANLAEEDQERLRSFRVPDLVDRNESRNVTVAGSPHTVASRVDWVRDPNGGTQSCSNSSTTSEYLRLTSTVTPPSSGAEQPTAPIVVRSLVAVPVGQYSAGRGTLAVNTIGGAGQPVEGVTATITGPSTLTGRSNALGCAVFGNVAVGDYQVTVSAAGFVDPAGNPTATASATASEATTNLTSVQYDRAGAVDVSFDTKAGATAAKPATSSALSAANAGVPATGVRVFTPAAPQTRIAATSLFPFAAPYTFFSGTCASGNPAKYDPNYFASNPGSVVVAPGASTAITVREPALQLTVTTQAAGAAVHVRATSVDPGCAEAFDWNVVTAGAAKSATLPEPGLPFGTYSVCADTGGKRKVLATNVALTTAVGSAAQTIALASGTSSGTCT